MNHDDYDPHAEPSPVPDVSQYEVRPLYGLVSAILFWNVGMTAAMLMERLDSHLIVPEFVMVIASVTAVICLVASFVKWGPNK